jgi:hypothetical protein
MPEQLATCPNCGHEFEVADVLTDSIREQLRRELEGDLVKKQEEVKKRLDEARQLEKSLAEREESIDDAVAEKLEAEKKKVTAAERKRAEQEMKGQLEDLQEQLAERGEKLEEANKRESELLKRQRALEEKEQSLALEVERQLEEERGGIIDKTRKQAEESFARKARETEESLKALEVQLAERDQKLDEAHKLQLEMLRKERELADRARDLDLELEKKLTEAQGALYEEAAKRAEEGQQLKLREKDDLIGRLKDEMRQMQRRMEQGSQESQGESLEDFMQEALEQAFPHDEFTAVKKGQRGADIVQVVHNAQGRPCGKILWEAKNAQKFGGTWTEKLKKDQMDEGADLAVLVAVPSALPPGIKQFGQMEDGGIWFAEMNVALGLCAALRQQLIRVAREKVMVAHRDTVKDALFDYVTSPEFGMRVRTVTDAFIEMQRDLASEENAMRRIWKKRQKQIDRVSVNMVEMLGELDGTVGTHTALSADSPLTLEHIADDEEGDE